MHNLTDRAREFAAGFTPGQKAISAIALIAALVGGLLYSHLAGQPSYAMLFTGLKAQDAQAITQKLTTDKVPYQLSDGGSTISVPASDVDSERLALSAAGLPSQTSNGFSDLEKQGLTATSSSQQAAYVTDLQNELSATISSIQGVSSAQVEVALPQTDEFGVASTDAQTTASVLVSLQPGTTLNDSQVTSIVHLVASAVPNLSPDNVTVADSNGNILAAPGVDTAATGGGSQTQAFDTSLSTSLEQLIATVAGPGNARVQVAGDLDYDKVTTTSHSVQQGSNGKPLTVPTASSQSTESYGGTGNGPTGALGSTTTTGTTSSGGSYKKTDTSKQYAIGTVSQTVEQAPGSIRRLSIAVLLNSAANVDTNQIQQLVSSAAGLQRKRGDTLSVVSMPFSAAAAKAAKDAAGAATAAKKSAALFSIVKTALLVIGLIVLVLLLIRQSRKEQRVEVPLVGGPPMLPAADTAAALVSRQARLALDEAPPPDDGLVRDVNEFIETAPDEVANLLRSWTRTEAANR